MKRPKRKKPKFRVGQVVRRDGVLFPIKEIRCLLGKYEYREIWSWHIERSLEPLTDKEIGPRRKQG